MTNRQLLALWPSSIIRPIRKWWIRRKLENAKYEAWHCEYMQHRLRDEQRYWQGQMALLKSDLHSI